MALVYAATIEVLQEESLTVADVTLTGDTTINLDADSLSSPGDKVIFKMTASAADRTVAFGTGFTAANAVILSGKTEVQEFVYDGTGFIATAAPVQID